MTFKEHVERAGVAKPRGWVSDKTRLLLGILGVVLTAGLALSQASCSSRSSSIPTPPTPPTPPSPPTTATSPVPTSETTTPASETKSSPTSPEAEGSQAGSQAPSEEMATAGSPGSRESSEAVEGAAQPAGKTSASESTPGGVAGGAQTTEERTGNLDRKLDSSLTEFDGILLKEQELLDERREAAGGRESMGGGYGATGEEASGSEASGGQQAGGEDQEYSAQDGASGGSPDTPQGEHSESSPEASAGGIPGQTDNGRIPPDVGDGSDDDIVARQLREAAEKEENPELREKLWDEYRAYKKGMKKD